MDNTEAERLDIEKTLAYLTLDEKVRMLSGDGMWHTFGTGELPRVRMADGPNGLRMTDGASASAVPATCYPSPSMLANSWDPALLYGVGAAIGKEATAMGVNLLLAPGLNIKRDPRGGRNFEYYSEDPLLSGELGKAFVSGVQSTGVGACIKHFAANNGETLRMYYDAVIDRRALHEIYLKPFELALAAKPAAVMAAYNKLNGEYCSQNGYLLTDVLRKQWGYGGVALSDWGAVHDRAAALRAGLDLAMPDSGGRYENTIYAALENNEITEDDIDTALRRLIKLIDDVYLEPYGDYDSEQHERAAYNAAAASIVMLKNDGGFLPLTKNMKVTVCGELAETAPVQGGGSSHVTAVGGLSPLEAFGARAVCVQYCRGYTSADPDRNAELIREAVGNTADSDAVIVFVGQPAPHEGIDRETTELPPEQNKLISELTAAGRKVAVVLCSAAPVLMPWINRVYAVIYAGLNGSGGALAAADALYGRINPCGKLAETFPADMSELDPDFGAAVRPYRESIFVGYRYYDAVGKRVLFPFGHGMSFSEINYDGIDVTRAGDAEFDVTVTLSNRSVRDAYETVQIYVADCTGRIMCAKKQLAAFRKVFVEGQTSTSVTVRLDRRAFEFYNTAADAFDVADGEYNIIVAASAADVKHTAAVKVKGNFFGRISAPPAYAQPRLTEITDADFEALSGIKIAPPPVPAVKGGYTLDNCIDDIKHTLPGRIAKMSVMRRAKSIGAENSPERQAFIANAMLTPLYAVSMMSDGAMPLSRAVGLTEMANGHFFKGLRLILKKQ